MLLILCDPFIGQALQARGLLRDYNYDLEWKTTFFYINMECSNFESIIGIAGAYNRLRDRVPISRKPDLNFYVISQ